MRRRYQAHLSLHPRWKGAFWGGLKTLHKYLARQVLASLAMTVVVFTFVMMVGNLLKEILTLLVSGQAHLGLVVEAVALLIPFLWVYALPMGLLTATLLVFGRFSADQELTAARASGISLISLISPILLISLACCGLSAWINMELGPESRVAYKNLIQHARSNFATVQLPEQTFIRDFPGYLCRVGRNRDGELEDIKIAKFETNNPNPEFLSAPTGRLESDPVRHVMHLYLTNAATSQWVGTHERLGMYPILECVLSNSVAEVFHPRISDMTFGQLQHEMREEDRLLHVAPAKGATPAELRNQMKLANQRKLDWTLPVRVEMNRQISFSFAGFAFALVGIPLGIRVHRRETNIGIVTALALAIVYYGFVLLGLSVSARPEFYPNLILWLPNFIFQAVGGVLLWRANRGF